MSKWYVLEMSEGAAEKIASKRRPAAVKRGAAFSEAWKMAKEITGYKDGKDGEPASPIFGMTRYQVYEELEGLFTAALQAVVDKRPEKFNECKERIDLLRSELSKRSAANDAARALRKA